VPLLFFGPVVFLDELKEIASFDEAFAFFFFL
jgi:hypothetical protein